MNILIVMTSHDQLGDTGRKTGLWLEEFAGRVDPGIFTPSPSQIPDLILSHHPARATA